MQTVLIDVLNEKAMSLLRDLEDLKIIRLLPSEPPKQKLSEQFRGSIFGRNGGENAWVY
ncbi:MAG: hypothetical protein LH606_18365 [Cytophagaceae bacterium]|nr:hypothetical protein [Cytophagaceae bacterium]